MYLSKALPVPFEWWQLSEEATWLVGYYFVSTGTVLVLCELGLDGIFIYFTVVLCVNEAVGTNLLILNESRRRDKIHLKQKSQLPQLAYQLCLHDTNKYKKSDSTSTRKKEIYIPKKTAMWRIYCPCHLW